MPRVQCGPGMAKPTEMPPAPIHEQIREARIHAGLTQAKLAELCEFHSQATVARLEGGNHPPQAETLYKIARALRCEFVISWRTKPD